MGPAHSELDLQQSHKQTPSHDSLQSADGSFSNGFDVEPQTDPRQTIYVLRTMSTTVSTNATHFNENVDTYKQRNTGLDTAA